jgi:purine nucleosidase
VLDPDAVAVVQRSGMRLDLIPYTAARQWPFTPADLAALAASGSAGRWVAQRSQDWLAFWGDTVGLDGFYPFDLMAVRYLLAPSRFRCAAVETWLADDPKLGPFDAPQSLLVAQSEGRPAMVPSGRARYCDRVEPVAGPALHGN